MDYRLSFDGNEDTSHSLWWHKWQHRGSYYVSINVSLFASKSTMYSMMDNSLNTCSVVVWCSLVDAEKVGVLSESAGESCSSLIGDIRMLRGKKKKKLFQKNSFEALLFNLSHTHIWTRCSEVYILVVCVLELSCKEFLNNKSPNSVRKWSSQDGSSRVAVDWTNNDFNIELREFKKKKKSRENPVLVAWLKSGS